MRACESCGASLEGRRSDARTCSLTCKERLKKRKQRGTVVEFAPRPVAGDAEPPVVLALIRDLEAAGRLDTAEGEHALFLCRRMAAAERDTGSGVASLSKEYRTARAEALKGAQVKRTRLDELRAQRDAKRGA